jgi:hypothetical protein
MKKNKLSQRNDEILNYRSTGIRLAPPESDGPATIDTEKRTVEVVAATENPVRVMDYDRWEQVDEILLMSGVRLPSTRQVPLLDSHSRWSSSDVIGSARELRIAGNELICRAHFSTVGSASDIFTKVAEGHLTDFSIGYRINKSIWIPEGQTQKIGGKSFTGPVKLVTDWTVKELSTTPIGADEAAKARSEYHTPKKEANKMPDWLKAWLQSRNLYRDDMTEAEGRALFEAQEMKRSAPVTPPQISAVENEDSVKIEKIRQAEQYRIREISAMCERFECSDMIDNLITSNTSVDEARKVVMDKFLERKNAQKMPGASYSVEPGRDERDKFCSAAEDSILIRLGQVQDVSKTAPGATELSTYSLRELARESLRIAGQSVKGNVLDLVGRALVTSDLPYIMAAGANKMMLAGWAAQDTTYQMWCGIDSLPDFKTMNLVSLSEADDLDTIPEGAKYNHGDVRDIREQAYLATYGKIFAITRQSIINDDLNAMMRVPEAYGRAARRKINAIAYAVLTANAAMADGVALFHSIHANVGTGGAISKTTVGEAFKLMRLQKGLKGLEALNIIPKYLIAPVTQEATAEAFFNTIQIANDAGDVLINQYSGNRITRIYDPILDATDTTSWYMAAEKGMTVNVFFLQGQTEPYMEQQQGWNVDGTELKVRIDAAAKAVDYRGLVMNEGE